VSEPTIVGRYAIYDRIAAGGMATVHYGRLLGQVGFARTVAIKRLHPQFAMDPEFVAMFLDEARLAARVSHPNVVSTLDVVARQGELFIVMEYVHGESLSGLLRSAREHGLQMPPAVVVSIISGLLRGLHAAHVAASDRGEPLHIVHRDVSPQNVLVGIDGMARVLDFGIAKALGQSHTTREGQVKGKLAYMATEQVLGGRVTPRTDIFAASVVLWEALTAKRLFVGDNDLALLHQLRYAEIAKPSSMADVPPALDAVVLKGLDREASARWETADAMAEALEDALAPASPRKVGEWVTKLAAKTLEDRARRVSEIESSSTMVAPDPDRQSALPTFARPTDATRINADDGTTVPDQLSSISVETGAKSTSVGRRKTPLVVPLVAAGGVTFTVLVAATVLATRPTPHTASPSMTPDASHVVAPAASVETIETSSASVAPPLATLSPSLSVPIPTATSAPHDVKGPSQSPIKPKRPLYGRD